MLNFITTGCSFTAGVIPKPHDQADSWLLQGSVWPHFIFAKMNPAQSTFKNLALPGGGNVAALTNLIYYLETNKSCLDTNNTVIGFNITEPARLDTICSLNHPGINRDLCCIDSTGLDHPSQELGFGWTTSGLNHRQTNIDIIGYLSVVQALAYLKLNKFRYFFMLMTDSIYTHAPDWFQSVLNQHSNNWITFDDCMSMHSMVLAHNLTVSDRDQHPSTEGHIKIAKYVDMFLTNNSWYE